MTAPTETQFDRDAALSAYNKLAHTWLPRVHAAITDRECDYLEIAELVTRMSGALYEIERAAFTASPQLIAKRKWEEWGVEPVL